MISIDEKLHRNLLENAKGSIRLSSEIKSDLLSVDLISPSDTLQCALLLTELMTKRSYIQPTRIIGPSYWRQYILKNRKPRSLMTRIATFFGQGQELTFRLYEENFEATRETIHYLDALEPPHNIPYLHVILRAALREMYGSKELSRENLEKLFSHEKPLMKWCENKIVQGFQLKQFAGQTNTLLGIYGPHIKQHAELLELITSDAQVNIDLGGGFSTPEISEAFSLDFTSYDIISPSKAFEWDLTENFLRYGDFLGEKYQDYLNKLKFQKFKYFDVFRDEFAATFESYNVTSFGFLNSTVESLSDHNPAPNEALHAFVYTMFFGCLRIAQLAHKVRRVSLVTHGRPNITFLHRTLGILFEDQKISSVVLPESEHAYMPFAYSEFHGQPLNLKQLSSVAEFEF